MSETITLPSAEAGTFPTWQPTSGEAMRHLRELLLASRGLPDANAWNEVEASASSILARCLRPDERGVKHRTGLVVGYVQSGKTISMTSVACLARDNGFGIVIVLAGTTDNLLEQSWSRFQSYLHVSAGPRRPWYMLSSARHELQKNGDGLKACLDSWRANNGDDRCRTAFLVVMKNHAHLEQLAQILRQVDAASIPALIIDDEADQAGLNTRPNGSASTTYQQIREVRLALKTHTYLQYTATPQAPLLITIADQLSPDFSVVLNAGNGYTGGRTFFVEERHLVHTIPQADLFSTGNPPEEAPESLLRALRVFFVGVALAHHGNAGSNRSMLVHPSPQQVDHDKYYQWVLQASKRWRALIRLPEFDPDSTDFRREFSESIDDLRATGVEVPDFPDLQRDLADALDNTLIHKVNSETGTEVEWKNSYSHILVGGQKLNRGYTVEGLTVTYMPRKAGTWTADTIQQLARFFGYKRGYLPLCRVYLHPDVKDVFEAYVDHEEDMRTQLRNHPGPLKTWMRRLYLESPMKPTRSTVLSDPYYRVNAKEWIIQVSSFDPAILETNRQLTTQLLDRVQELLQVHPMAPDRHRVVEFSLAELAESFLFPYQVVGDHDEAGFFSAKHMIGTLLTRQPDLLASLVIMGQADRTERGGELVKLHQGYDRQSRGVKYPGASKIADPKLVTIQVHNLTVNHSGSGESTTNVPTLAIKIPESLLGKDMIYQQNHAK